MDILEESDWYDMIYSASTDIYTPFLQQYSKGECVEQLGMLLQPATKAKMAYLPFWAEKPLCGTDALMARMHSHSHQKNSTPGEYFAIFSLNIDPLSGALVALGGACSALLI